MNDIIFMTVIATAFTAFCSLFIGLADTLKWFAAILAVGAALVGVGYLLNGCSSSLSSEDPCDGRAPSFLGDPRC